MLVSRIIPGRGPSRDAPPHLSRANRRTEQWPNNTRELIGTSDAGVRRASEYSAQGFDVGTRPHRQTDAAGAAATRLAQRTGRIGGAGGPLVPLVVWQ